MNSSGLVAVCIDDSAIDLELNVLVLERSGRFDEVLTFTSGEGALAHLRQKRPVDAIFLDINMPMMDGFEFLEAATLEFGEDRFARSVVFMLTSSLNPADRKRAKSFSVVHGFLTKPLTVEQANDIATNLPSII